MLEGGKRKETSLANIRLYHAPALKSSFRVTTYSMPFHLLCMAVI